MSSSVLAALQATPTTVPVDTGLETVRAIVALITVTVVLAGFLWLLKRGTFAATARGGRQGLSIESALSLGDRRSLVIVGVEGRRLLLGLAPAHVSLITELERPPATFGSTLDGAVPPGERTRS